MTQQIYNIQHKIKPWKLRALHEKQIQAEINDD